MNSQQLPNNPDAERALLGAFLIDPAALERIHIQPDDFYTQRHRQIFNAMLRIQRLGRAVDYITVAGELNGKEDAYLSELLAVTPTSLHAESYAAAIIDTAQRRRIIQEAGKLAAAAFSGGDDLPGHISKTISALACLSAGEDRAEHWGNAISRLYDHVEAASENPAEFWGIRTGISAFDRLTGGLHTGEVSIFSGEPGVGKSLFAVQLGVGAADPKIGNTPGVIYELEMGALQLVRRVISAAAKVRTRSMMTGRLEGDEWTNFTQAVDRLSQFNVYLSDASGWTTTSLRADLSRLKSEVGIRWALVDYLELLKDAAGINDVDRTKFISGQLKAIAKDLDISLLVVQSQNKAGISGLQRGTTSLAGSVRIAYDADQVWTLRKTDDNKVRLTAEKLREGDGTGEFIELVRLPGFPAFGESL